MNVKRVTRLLQLLQALQSGEGGNADQLAEVCGVSRRTVFRDIEALKKAGVPVRFDHGKDRYAIPGAFFLPPTNFTAEEALALIGLATQLGRSDALPFYDPARRAALKLEANLPAKLREHLRDLTGVIRFNPPQVNPLDGKYEVYQCLVDACAEKRAVKLVYDSLTEWERIETTFRPYQLLFSQRSWYVIGRSSLHREVRTFNLGRIAEIRRLAQAFGVPKRFSLDQYLGNAWRLIPDSGPDHEVHVRFAPMVAQNVAEVLWHKTQRCEPRDDGSLDFYATVSGLHEISWWILGYGDQAEAIQPSELRELIATRAATMAQAYRNDRA